MKGMIGLGIMLIVAGCGPAISPEITADSVPEGWYSQSKTADQLSQDMDQCRILCQTA